MGIHIYSVKGVLYMNRDHRILFDKKVVDMVKSLTRTEIKDEIGKVDQMITEAQDTLSELLAYKDFLYREAWFRGQKRNTKMKAGGTNDMSSCKTCINYDKLLNICFVNNPDWKHVWDETEACEKWESHFTD